MVLKFKCQVCAKDFVFYNPCSFLLHTRQHYNLIAGEINLDNLEISTLPFGLGGFLPDPNIPMLYNYEDDNIGETTFINTRFYSPLHEYMGHSVIHLAPNELLFFFSTEPNMPSTSLVLKQMSSNIPRCQFVNLDTNRFTPIPNGLDINGKEVSANNNPFVEIKQEREEVNTNQYSLPIITKIETINESNNEMETSSNLDNFPYCPECDQMQHIPMGAHFLSTDNLFDDTLKCSICKYIAPTKCSLQAHERIHNNKSPYVCPECGKDFNNSDLLYSHLEDVCFHLTKQVRHRCPGKKCGKIFAQIATFSTHFVVHSKCLISCGSCKYTFYNEEEFFNHTKVHNIKRPPIKTYTCQVCEDVDQIYNEIDFQQHIEWHASDRKQFLYVYICKHCHSYFRSTLTYATHLLRCSKLVSHVNLNPQNDQVFKRKRVKNTIQISLICYHCRIHRKVNRLNSMNPRRCINCGKKTIYKYNINEDDLETILKIGPISNDFLISDELVSCLLCEKQLQITEINNHFNLNRCKFNNAAVALISENDNQETMSPKSNENFQKSHKRNSGSSTSSCRKSSTSNSDNSMDNIEEPIQFDGIYRCKLCEYSNYDREEFQLHIIKHRNVRTAYQCMECGQCFVVKPSLIKHLTFYHEISNTDDYLERNNCFDEIAVKELEDNMRLAPNVSKRPVAENQCRVCFLKCDNSLELNKHFRIHGMAFLLQNSK